MEQVGKVSLRLRALDVALLFSRALTVARFNLFDRGRLEGIAELLVQVKLILVKVLNWVNHLRPAMRLIRRVIILLLDVLLRLVRVRHLLLGFRR